MSSDLNIARTKIKLNKLMAKLQDVAQQLSVKSGDISLLQQFGIT